MIYETKGLALEQVDELYGVVSQAWKSREFRPQVIFQDFDEVDGGEKKRGMSMSEMAQESQRRRSTVDRMDGAAGGTGAMVAS